MLARLPQQAEHPKVLAGFGHAEDAGVYQLSEDMALIQTVDFFTPVVDDPFDFGQIAAANSLSDIYAIGGTPICALNIVAFPIRCLGLEILEEILRGGAAALAEAEIPLIGGHSIEDEEVKYGLSVAGLIHPQKIIRNNTPKPGDKLVLTKPIGTGVIATALKAEMANPDHVRAMIRSMKSLNKLPARIMQDYEAHACTDITGFGLLGHIREMVNGSGCTIRIYSQSIPFIEGAPDYARMGLVPAGAYRNREYVQSCLTGFESLAQETQDLLVDPQTSGGLLISLPADSTGQFLETLRSHYTLPSAIIGEVVAGPEQIQIARQP